MKRLIQYVLVTTIILVPLCAHAGADSFINIEGSNLTATVRWSGQFNSGILPPDSPAPEPKLSSTGSLTVDNEGFTYVVMEGKEITCLDPYHMSPYTIATAVGDRTIKGIECDNDGNMLVSVEEKPEKYVLDPWRIIYNQRIAIIEISGFSSLRDELDDIKYVDIAVIQQQIDEIKTLLEQLPQLKQK